MELLRLAFLVIHVVAGTLALGFGVVPLFTVKGGALHRRSGRLYAWAMGGVIGSAVVLTVLGMDLYFMALTTAAAIGAFSGVRVLKRKRPDIDPGQQARPLDWAVAVAVGAAGLGLLAWAASGQPTRNTSVFYALIGGALSYAAYDLWRFAFPRAWPFFPRLWFYEHLVKMLGSYSAVVAAFSGSVLQFLPIPEPWKQLWPTILFHNLMIVLIVRYALQARSRRRAAA